ncbi:MAG: hypothetical protein R3F61_30685 [Myxococcota bacterium]
MFGRKDLSVRAERVTLEPSHEAGWVDLLFAEGEQDGWRIVELSSANGRPFDADLSWSAANGAGSKALVTVARAGRVCIYGRSVSVRARNLHFLPNAVGVTVADGFAHTQNQLEVRGEGSASGPHAIRVPAFARTVRIETYDPDDTSGVLWVIDGDNKQRSGVRVANQPPEGVPVGGASEVWFWPQSEAPLPFRAIFHLNL